MESLLTCEPTSTEWLVELSSHHRMRKRKDAMSHMVRASGLKPLVSPTAGTCTMVESRSSRIGFD